MAHIASKVRLLAAQGLTDDQIAEQCEVRNSYVTKILNRRPLRGRPLELTTMIDMAERMSKDAPDPVSRTLCERLAYNLRQHLPQSKSNQAGGSIEAGRGVESDQAGGS